MSAFQNGFKVPAGILKLTAIRLSALFCILSSVVFAQGGSVVSSISALNTLLGSSAFTQTFQALPATN